MWRERLGKTARQFLFNEPLARRASLLIVIVVVAFDSVKQRDVIKRCDATRRSGRNWRRACTYLRGRLTDNDWSPSTLFTYLRRRCLAAYRKASAAHQPLICIGLLLTGGKRAVNAAVQPPPSLPPTPRPQ